MARTAKKITNGNRIAEALSIGILGRAYPRRQVRAVLHKAGRESVRRRDLNDSKQLQSDSVHQLVAGAEQLEVWQLVAWRTPILTP